MSANHEGRRGSMGSMSDYKALVAEAQIYPPQRLARRLADAVEALILDSQDAVAERNAVEDERDALARAYDDLVAERDALKAENAESERQRLLLSRVNAETLAEHSTLRAERDALRAQLDKVRDALDEYREHTLPGVWLAMRLADVVEWEATK